MVLREDVTNLRYDTVGKRTGTDTDSTWRAGVNGAKPGITMPGQAVVGLKLFQEHAPEDNAMDYAEVLATNLVIVGRGGTFRDVVKTFEGSTTDADLREYKYYAPAVGMIRADEELTEAFDNSAIIVELQP